MMAAQIMQIISGTPYLVVLLYQEVVKSTSIVAFQLINFIFKIIYIVLFDQKAIKLFKKEIKYKLILIE